jgi:hypothetical protein
MMSAEDPHFTLYSRIVREAHEHAYSLGGDPEVIDQIVPGLITSVLDAFEAGFSREEIVKAIEKGLDQGERQFADPTGTAEYWEALRAEVEEFWVRRYDPNGCDNL